MIQMLETLIRNISDYGLERVFKRYYSLYRAEVVSNKDETGRGLIEIKVPQLFGDNALPNKAEPRDFRGAGKGKGEFYPPDVGDWVYVEFSMGDQRFPVYSGGWYGEGELSDEFAYTNGEPLNRGRVNKYGHVLKFDETPGKERVVIGTPSGNYIVLDDTKDKEGMFFIHKTGAQLQIDKDGSTKVLAKDGSFINMDAVKGAITATSKSGAYITVKDVVTASDASGKHFISINGDSIVCNTAGDHIVQSNTHSVKSGSTVIDSSGAKMTMGSGKVAFGANGVELLDHVIQGFDALVSSPSLVTTGVGPSSPLMPPASVQLTKIKVALMLIKGSL